MPPPRCNLPNWIFFHFNFRGGRKVELSQQQRYLIASEIWWCREKGRESERGCIWKECWIFKEIIKTFSFSITLNEPHVSWGISQRGFWDIKRQFRLFVRELIWNSLSKFCVTSSSTHKNNNDIVRNKKKKGMSYDNSHLT